MTEYTKMGEIIYQCWNYSSDPKPSERASNYHIYADLFDGNRFYRRAKVAICGAPQQARKMLKDNAHKLKTRP